jgi:hypothetical protein
MRIEATIPDSRGAALVDLSTELRLSRSQVIDEALALFLKAVLEVRKGRRVVSVGQAGDDAVCEVVTPTLAQLEWTSHRQALKLPAKAVERITHLASNPPEPPQALRDLLTTEST